MNTMFSLALWSEEGGMLPLSHALGAFSARGSAGSKEESTGSCLVPVHTSTHQHPAVHPPAPCNTQQVEKLICCTG